MEIEIIENIVSKIPLYVIKNDSLTNIPNSEEKIVTKILVGVEIRNKSKTTVTQDGFLEGGVDEVYSEIKRQKRNPKLREEAIRAYGYNCMVCDFSFEDTYGDFGVGYIEVHHLELLSAIKDERLVNIKDVSVVCANCHRVLHRNGEQPISIDELQKVVKERKERLSK